MASIGVVVPVYNKVHYLSRLLECLELQISPPDSVIFVDDASTDGSGEFLAKASVSFNKKVVRLSANQGVSAARNVGLQEIRCNYVCFLDADDYWAPEYLLRVRLALGDRGDIEFLSTGYSFVEPHGVRVAKVMFEPGDTVAMINDYCCACLHGDPPVTSSSVCVKRETLIRLVGGFDEGLSMGEDQLMWIRLSYGTSLYHLPQPLAFYDRTVLESSCRRASLVETREYVDALVDDVSGGIVPNKLRPSICAFIGRAYLGSIVYALHSHDRERAKELYLRRSKMKILMSRFDVVSRLLMLLPNYFSRFICRVYVRKFRAGV